jgi:O-antigen ligase
MFELDTFTVQKLKLIGLHIIIGVVIGFLRDLSSMYFYIIILFFTIAITNSKDKTYYVLAGAAYIASAEIFLRMTKAMPFWEMGKYMVIYFVGLGIVYKGFKLEAWSILLYLLLLIPGIYVAYLNFDFLDESFRKTILFNLSGPLSLFATALFAFQLKFDFKKMMRLVDIMIYPIISMTVYIFIYAPTLEDIQFTTESNQFASGGYSGNQVATILGLGMFLCYVRFIIPYRNIFLQIINISFLVLFSYRGLLTFSRGGIITAIIMMLIFTFYFINWAPVLSKAKASLKLLSLGFGAVVLWGVTVSITGGLIANRYLGQRADGEQKDITTGRIDILQDELMAFQENPFMGLGIGMGKFYRAEITGHVAASHNEVSRMISEHGLFGILALLILFLVPLYLLLKRKRNLFLVPFIAFWFLTINHSAMRVALPGFLYSLGLLQITYQRKKKVKKSVKKHPIHREQAIT